MCIKVFIRWRDDVAVEVEVEPNTTMYQLISMIEDCIGETTTEYRINFDGNHFYGHNTIAELEIQDVRISMPGAINKS